MEQLRSAIVEIAPVDYQVESTSGNIIKEIIDKRVKN